MARPEEYPPPRGGDVPGSMQYLMPYWAMSAANWVAQYANRHVYKYGMTREQLGQIAINAHRNAQLNPRARNISRKELTLDEYLEARMITTPLCLWDCDRYSDCSTVLIVSAQDALDEIKTTPIRIAAMSGSIDNFSWDQPEWTSSYDAGRDLWTCTDYTVKEVDTIQFYDGFSFLPVLEGRTQAGRDGVFTQFHQTAGQRSYPMRCVQTARYGYIFNPWSNGSRVFHNESQAGRSFRAMQAAAADDAAIADRVALFLHRVPEELYDFAKDPDALENRIADPACAAERVRLQEALEAWMQKTKDPALEAFRNRHDPSACEAAVQQSIATLGGE